MSKKKKPKKNKMPPQQPKRRKSLPKEAKDMMLELDTVVYINRKDGCTRYHLIDGDFKLVDATLALLDAWLRDENFHRVHKSSIVNLKHISRVDPCGDGLMLILTGEIPIKVSRSEKKTFRVKYSIYKAIKRLKDEKGGSEN